MSDSGTAARKADRSLLAIGALFAASGLYFILVGLGILPPPGRIYGPHWLVFAAGLVFIAGGISVLVRGWLAVPDHESQLPADAPGAAATIQWIAALVIIVSLASIGSWIAFAGGDREFATNVPVQGSLRETVGRVAFGIGAVITWLLAAAVAYSGAKKVFRKNPDPSS
jgi:hypothetical protein